MLSAYCESQGWEFEIIEDLGSGLNYKKKGLHRLIEKITHEQISRLVITHKDRLLRFGSELIFSLCKQFGVEVIILNRKANSSFEEDLVSDVLEIFMPYNQPPRNSSSGKFTANTKILK